MNDAREMLLQSTNLCLGYDEDWIKHTATMLMVRVEIMYLFFDHLWTYPSCHEDKHSDKIWKLTWLLDYSSLLLRDEAFYIFPGASTVREHAS